MSNLRDEIYIISINDGEDEQHIQDEVAAEQLYADLIASPADTYNNIRLLKYNFNTGEETVLDSYVFESLEPIESDNLASEAEIETTEALIDYSKYTTLVYTAQALANDFKYIHWNCCGKHFDKIHEISEEYYTKLTEDLDLFAEIALEESGITLANPANMANKINWNPVEDCNSIDATSAIKLMHNLLGTYLETLTNNYNDFDSDIQSELDTIIRFWKKELHYKLRRRIEVK